MSSFGYTAAFAIMVSLLVSFTLTPMLCSRFLKPCANGNGSGATKDTVLFRAMARPYRADAALVDGAPLGDCGGSALVRDTFHRAAVHD